MGKRIKDVTGVQTTFLPSLVLLVDKVDTGSGDWLTARKMELGLIGNTRFQGSNNNVNWHDIIEDNDEYFQFSTDNGVNWKSLNTSLIRENINLYFTEARVLATTGVADAITATHVHTNWTLLQNLIDNGDGNSYLANNGTYKSIPGEVLLLNQSTPQSVINGAPIMEGIQFDITPSTSNASEGLLRWNATDGTLDLGMSGGDITMQLGQEMFIKVRNVSGITISNGTPVYISGRTGNRPNIYLARSDSETTSAIAGITTQDIADNTDGYITTLGYVRQIKTNYTGTGDWGTTWVEGDRLYVSKTVAGQLTNVEPATPHHSDIIGTIGVVGAAGIGSILVNISKHNTLQELSDINGTALTATGQLPVWNQTTSYFDFNYNINNYLPYTGASANVSLGTYSITALKLISTETIRLKNYTVSTLPSAVQGDTAYVTDAVAPTYLGTLTGGGTVITPVFYNGSVWVSY